MFETAWGGISRSELVQLALQQYLKDHSQVGVTEALNAAYAEDPDDKNIRAPFSP